MSDKPDEKWLRKKADQEDKFGPVTAGDMSEAIDLFERENCGECSDGLREIHGPIIIFKRRLVAPCNACHGSGKGKYIDKIAAAALWVVEGGECQKCHGYGIIIGHGYADCPACFRKRRFEPEQLLIEARTEDGPIDVPMSFNPKILFVEVASAFMRNPTIQSITITAPDGRQAICRRDHF